MRKTILAIAALLMAFAVSAFAGTVTYFEIAYNTYIPGLPGAATSPDAALWFTEFVIHSDDPAVTSFEVSIRTKHRAKPLTRIAAVSWSGYAIAAFPVNPNDIVGLPTITER